MPDPTNISTSNKATALPLLPNEQVIFEVRAKFLLTFLFILALWGAGGLLLYGLLRSHSFNLLASFISPMVQMIIYLGVFFLVGAIIFLSWLNTIYILTNKRVESQFGIVSKGTISLALDQTQDVILNISVFGRIFNFGKVIIQSASLSREIIFNNIADPHNRADQIQNAVDAS